jgi:hypothetical protein
MALKTTKKANTKMLFDHLCDQMAKLNIRAIDVEEAKAQSNLVKQANNLLKYELDRAKALQKFEDLEIREIEDF